MPQLDKPRLNVSEELYLALVRQNPDLRLERLRDGTLIIVPPTGGDGSRQNATITSQLETWSRRDGTGVVFDSNGGFRLPDGATRAADAAWLEKSRWLQLTAEQRRGFPPLCPDFVIELLSPSDDLEETRAKVGEFIENGARLGWLIDSFRRVVEVYRPNRQREVLENPRTVNGEDVMPDFTLDLAPIFDDPALT